MTLARRTLGTSGVEISTVGLGGWAIGGADWSYSWGPQDDDVSIATMHRAVEHGINWIDTAAVYGLGHSEIMIGRLLRELQPAERPMVFTKCGLVWDQRTTTGDLSRSLAPDSIRRECEASLERLGVERIDLYQCHWPDESGARVEDSWAEMARLVEAGKVRLVGVSNFDTSLLTRCEAVAHVDSLQPPFSLLRRDAAAAEIPWCAGNGTGVICYSPMQSGLLTGSFSSQRLATLAPDDWRRRSARFQEPNLSTALALRDRLRPIAMRHEATVAAVAIAWTLSWPGLSGAIVGARAPEQIDDWVNAGRLTLTDIDLGDIEEAIRDTGAGSGPASPHSERISRGPEQ